MKTKNAMEFNLEVLVVLILLLLLAAVLLSFLGGGFSTILMGKVPALNTALSGKLGLPSGGA